MKLRNKKTGEITDLAKRGLLKSDNDNHIIVYPEGTLKYYAYDSLAELNEEWEDYKEPEPLIKDAGVREVLRLWAMANHIPRNAKSIEYQMADTLEGTLSEFWCDSLHIVFWSIVAPDAIHGQCYTVDELCGEEETSEPKEPTFIDLDERIREAKKGKNE